MRILFTKCTKLVPEISAWLLCGWHTNQGFSMTTESNPFFSLCAPRVAACLTLQGSFSTPLVLASEDWCAQVLFRCFWSYKERRRCVSNLDRKSHRVYGTQVFYLVSSCMWSLALLSLCFVSMLYAHRNETSCTSNIRIFLAIVMPADSRRDQKCSNLILLGCCFLQFSKQFYIVKVSYLCTKPADCCCKEFALEV